MKGASTGSRPPVTVGATRVAMDVFAWSSNVVTSIAIIFMTKTLMAPPLNFSFATVICGLHFMSCAFVIRGAAAIGLLEHIEIPFKFTLLFSLIGAASIASANLSLLLNTVGFYQISKLLLAPFVCLIESVFLGKRFSVPVLLSILVTMVGVGIVTVSNVESNLLGTLMAGIFIVTSGMQQVLCGHYQAKFGLASHQLLANTAPVQGAVLLIIGPYLDELVTGDWLGDWIYSLAAMEVLAISCFIAIGTNLSQFLCLGRFTATTFQVLGHAKTILVLFGGWAIFHEGVTPKQLAGMILAVLGMVSYGVFMSRGGVTSSPSQRTPQASPSKDSLLREMRASESSSSSLLLTPTTISGGAETRSSKAV